VQQSQFIAAMLPVFQLNEGVDSPHSFSLHRYTLVTEVASVAFGGSTPVDSRARDGPFASGRNADVAWPVPDMGSSPDSRNRSGGAAAVVPWKCGLAARYFTASGDT
jgi:hypothetical protein